MFPWPSRLNLCRGVTALLCTVATLTSSDGIAAAVDSRPASAIKAAYLFKFSSYVQWPERAFPTATSPAVLCVVGDDPFGTILDDTMNGRQINDRPVVVRRLKAVSEASECLVLYIGGASVKQASEALGVVKGAGVLTVTDAASDSNATGIINFVVQNDNVRFSIDEAAAATNGLAISSKLLSLAVSTKARN